MDCPHSEREQIAPPQLNVHRNRLVQIRRWFCRTCELKWDTEDDLGAVGSISLSVEMAAKHE